MIAITTKMRIRVALEPCDMRKRIDGLCKIVRSELKEDPFSGITFVFRSRAGRDIALLRYDGQGFWVCQKRLSEKTFIHWPASPDADAKSKSLLAQELYTLIWGGNPATGEIAPLWRPVPIDPDDTMINTLRPPSVPATSPPSSPYAARAAAAAAVSSCASVSP